MRKVFLSTLVALVFAPIATAESHLPKANTRDAIKGYVESAAKVIEQQGPSCDTFKSKEWMSGDDYVFVTGPEEKIVCHANAAMIGKPEATIVDANGKKVALELDEIAKKGGGWVDSVWPRPGETKPVAKSSYAIRAKAPDGKWYVVGAGGYDMK